MASLLITEGQFREFAGIHDADNDERSRIEEYIYAASNMIETKLDGRTLIETAHTLTTDGLGITRIQLNAPVNTSQTFTIAVGGTNLTQNTDYYLYPESGIVKFVYKVTDSSFRNTVVTYTGGYVNDNPTGGQTELPYMMKMAVYQWASYLRNRSGNWELSTLNKVGTSANTNKVFADLPNIDPFLDSFKTWEHNRASNQVMSNQYV